MSRRLFLAVKLAALVGTAGGLSGCVAYTTPGYAYRSPGFYAPPPVYRPYRPFPGPGYYGRPGWGGPGWGGPGWGGHRGYYGRPYW